MIPSLAETVLGMLLLFLAVFLWAVYRRFSAAVLSMTAFFFYGFLAVRLFEFYGVLVMRAALRDIVRHALLLLTLVSFIITLIVFISEEKMSA